MELLKSIGLFLWGIARRFYYWMPFVLLDITDLWGRYLRRFGEMPANSIVIFTALAVTWAAILTFHEQRRQSVHYGSRPQIRIQPARSGDNWFLNMHNDGDTGVFAAQILILKSNNDRYGTGSNYMAEWSNTDNDKAEIMRGHFRSLKITRPLMWEPEPKAIDSRHLRDPAWMRGPSYRTLMGIPESQEGDVTVEYEYEIKISISSSPSLAGGVLHKRYTLNKYAMTEL